MAALSWVRWYMAVLLAGFALLAADPFSSALTSAPIPALFILAPAAVALIAVGRLSDWSLLFWVAIAVGLYSLAHGLVWHWGRAEVPLGPYRVIYDLTLVVAMLWVAHVVGRGVSRAQRDLDHFGFSSDTPPPRLTEDCPEIQLELLRCRRQGCPLGVALLQVVVNDGYLRERARHSPVLRDVCTRHIGLTVAGSIRRALRRTESFYETEGKHQFAIVSPGSNTETMLALMRRLESMVENDLDELSAAIRLEYRVAAFPDDAVTIAGLLQAAQVAPERAVSRFPYAPDVGTAAYEPRHTMVENGD